MLTDPELTLRLLSRIYYGLPGRSAEFNSIWYSVADILFRDIGKKNRTFISTRQARSPIWSTTEFNAELSQISEATALEILAVLKIVSERSSKEFEYSIASEISGLLEQYFETLKSESYLEKFNSVYKKISTEFLNRQKTRPVEIKVDITLLYLDYLLRWLVLGFYRIQTIDPIDNAFFLLINVLLIPGLIFVLAYFRSRNHSHKLEQLLIKHDDNKEIRVKTLVTSGQYTLLAFMAGTGIFIFSALAGGWDILIFLFLGLPIAIYYIIFLKIFSTGSLRERDFLHQKESWKDTDQFYDPDRNDEEIVDIESRLKAVVSRLDAYVLESALLGALSFSGFLQIISQNLVSIHDLYNFGANLGKLFTGLVLFDIQTIREVTDVLLTSSGLFSMVSVETLLCSLFFLMVIAARLRFSNISDKVSHALKKAEAFNQKEELLFNKIGKEKWAERMGQINITIGQSLEAALIELERIKPIHNFIQYFRNAGLGMFFIILVSCSFFLSGIIATIFLTLALFTVLYLTEGGTFYRLENWKNMFTDLVINRKYVFVILSVGLILTGYILRMVFQVENTYTIIIAGAIILGVFLIAEILLTPVVTNEAGFHPKNQINIISTEHTLYDWLLVGSFLTFFFGLFLKALRYLGASFCFGMFPILLIAVFLHFGYKFFKNKYLGITIGIIFSISALSTSLRILHLPGPETVLVPIFLIPIIYILLIFGIIPRAFLLKSFTLFYLAVFFIFPTTLYRKINTGYDYYTASVKEINFIQGSSGNAADLYDQLVWGSQAIHSLKGNIEECNLITQNYISKFGNHPKQVRMLSEEIAQGYIDAVQSALPRAKDTLDLNTLFGMITLANKINENNKFRNKFVNTGILTEAEILNLLVRKDEAVKYLMDKESGTMDNESKKEIKKKIDEILSSDLKMR